VPRASIILVATSLTAPWISLPSALQGVVAGSATAAGADVEGAAVLADGVALPVDGVGEAVVASEVAALDEREGVHPATNKAPVPSSRARLSHVMDPVSAM
jgi:hypothetical protein